MPQYAATAFSDRENKRFWKGLLIGDAWCHFDLSEQQLPAGQLSRPPDSPFPPYYPNV